MKLRAKISREKQIFGKRMIRYTFPPDAKWPFYIPEVITARNIGPRPWAEGFMTNDKGETVRVFFEC